jgi:superfamily II DNA/RNA helicase
VHRIGRTGRAGKSGTAITLVAPIDVKAVSIIEKLIGQEIPYIDGPAPSADAPVEDGTNEQRETRGERPRRGGRGRGERKRHPERQGQDRQPREERAPRQPREERAPAAEVARLDQARPRKPQQQPRPAPANEPADTDHLPAFLLRPFRVKA